MIIQKLIRELFDYRDGNLFWKTGRQRVKIGCIAGYVNKLGYREIGINYKHYLAHRLIFLYHHGFLPKYIDHIDGDPLNNNINNLREATSQENNWHRKKIKSINGKPTSSKFKGVSWDKSRNKYVARIRIDGKSKNLGRFVSETDAAKAYTIAAIKHRGEFAKLNSLLR